MAVTVREVKLVRDQSSGTFRGFAFITMPEADADRAIAALHGKTFSGRELVVAPATDKHHKHQAAQQPAQISETDQLRRRVEELELQVLKLRKERAEAIKFLDSQCPQPAAVAVPAQPAAVGETPAELPIVPARENQKRRSLLSTFGNQLARHSRDFHRQFAARRVVES